MGFGDFDTICTKTPLPLCPLVGPLSPITGAHSIQTNCYSRTVELANTMIFQGAASFAHILALIMLVIMIIHVRSKFTAVGMRKEELERRQLLPVRGGQLTIAQVVKRLHPFSTHIHSLRCVPSSSTQASYHLRAAHTHTLSRSNVASSPPPAFV